MAKSSNVPEIRFAGFTDPWEQRKLGEFSKKITTKNADGGLSETFTNSAEQGVISQLDYFDHDITNDANISGYYVVQPDNFVYNPRISVTAPCGPINRNRLNRAGVMSPLYTVFSVDESVDKTYLEHYFKTSRWHDFMFLEGNSGARSDRFSISDATFFEMPIWCPKIPEQRAIAKQLETTDSLITLHQRKYDKLVAFKKAMLEKMFPKEGETVPEIRFAGFTDPWEQRKLGELGFAQSGIGFPDTEQGGTEGTPFFKVSDMNMPGNEHELIASNNYVTPEQIARMGWHPINQVPAIFFAKVGAAVMLNRKRLVNKPFLLDNNTMAFSMDSSLLNTQFGQSLFERLDLTSLIQVGALPSYNSSDVESITVSLPSTMDEQRQIGQCLCNINDLITLHQCKQTNSLLTLIAALKPIKTILSFLNLSK